MEEKLFQLDIVTPRKIVFSDMVMSVSAPGELGGFQVLIGHAPLLSSLVIGEIKITDKNGKTERYATTGGFFEVRDNKVILLAETAEKTSEIDINRAEASQKRAKDRLHKRETGTDLDRAEAALRRALNRLRVAGRN
jgi:F-type H+-transporting ATPase subunit epsilon